MKTARQLAAEALIRVEEDGAWSNLALGALLERSGLARRDRAFAGALYYGTLSRLLTLDACLTPLCGKPLPKLDRAVRAVLRTAVYQLLYMPSVPERAVLSEAVALTKRMRKTSAGGFVNGVLRSFLRSGKSIPMPEGPLAKQMEVEYSCPAALVDELVSHYGEDAIRLMLGESLKPPPVFLRVNPVKTTPDKLVGLLAEQGVKARALPDMAGCLMLRDQGAASATDAYRDGLFHIQDRSSQLAAMSLGAKPGERILDCCAAPGGKSFTIAGLMENSGEIIATDLYPHRVGLIEKRTAELGFDIIKPSAADMTVYDPALGEFDRVLCDAPCSGLGVIRRRPEIKYKRQDYRELEALQYKILKTASSYCKKGGVLIYSTCTVRPAENGGITERFLEEHPNFEPAVLSGDSVPARLILPGENGGDGFFIAAFVRTS